MNAQIMRETLSDNSNVFDVRLTDIEPLEEDGVEISCKSEEDAEQFIQGLEELLQKHTTIPFDWLDTIKKPW